ncbi:hypothetical protein Tco_1371017 [Tanacetum coccineum]
MKKPVYEVKKWAEKEGMSLNKEGGGGMTECARFRAELDNNCLFTEEGIVPGLTVSTNRVSTVSPYVSAAGQSFDNDDDLLTDPLMPDLEDILISQNLVNQKDDGIFISQDKYVADILKKFDFITVKTTSTPIETNKALLKNEEAEDVDVHLYRSMIRSLIYLKGQPKLGLWYPRDSPFDLEAFSDSDYAGASLDRKSTTGGCQFLGKRLISWQCKKQTIVANSTTEAEYVAAANCCGQVIDLVQEAWRVVIVRLGMEASNYPMIPLPMRDETLQIGYLRERVFGKEYVSKREKSGGTRKAMFDDSNFAELDVDNAMDNVKGDAETQGRNTTEQTTTVGDTVNTTKYDSGIIFEDEMMTIADTLVAIRSTRPRTTSVIIHDVKEEPRRSTPAPTTQPSSKDKGKALMVEPEKPSKNPRKAQIQMDEELGYRLMKKKRLERKNAKRDTELHKKRKHLCALW